MGISNEKHVLDSSGEIVYRSPWMSEAMRYADERGYTVIRDQSSGRLIEKDEYGVWIRQPPSLPVIQVAIRPPAVKPPRTSNEPPDILSRLLEMAANPPGFNGISTPDGVLGNRYIDLGWVAAVRMVIEMVTADSDRQRAGDSKAENNIMLT